jgi:hypothetical protein
MKKLNNHLVVNKNINDKEIESIAIYNSVLDGFILIDDLLSSNNIKHEFIDYLGNYHGSDFFLDSFLYEFRIEKSKVHKVGKLYALFVEYQNAIKQNGIDSNEFVDVVFTYSDKTNKIYLTIGQSINGGSSAFSFDNEDNRLYAVDLFNKNKIVKLLNLD